MSWYMNYFLCSSNKNFFNFFWLFDQWHIGWWGWGSREKWGLRVKGQDRWCIHWINSLNEALNGQTVQYWGSHGIHSQLHACIKLFRKFMQAWNWTYLYLYFIFIIIFYISEIYVNLVLSPIWGQPYLQFSVMFSRFQRCSTQSDIFYTKSCYVMRRQFWRRSRSKWSNKQVRQVMAPQNLRL